MRVIVQRSKESSVIIDGKVNGKIDKGYVLLVGFTQGDTKEIASKMAFKIAGLRIFSDSDDKLNLSLKDINGEILSISQFTLYADTTKGNRPSYFKALNGDEAIKLYEKFNEEMNKLVPTKPGIFGAEMMLNITNDGPITILLEF